MIRSNSFRKSEDSHYIRELPAARSLARLLEAEQGEHIANGVHLIVVRSADNSLVVGDSHHYAAAPDPFAPASVDLPSCRPSAA